LYGNADQGGDVLLDSRRCLKSTSQIHLFDVADRVYRSEFHLVCSPPVELFDLFGDVGDYKPRRIPAATQTSCGMSPVRSSEMHPLPPNIADTVDPELLSILQRLRDDPPQNALERWMLARYASSMFIDLLQHASNATLFAGDGAQWIEEVQELLSGALGSE
jgi:hypothetical protein